jgi:hypothetical protein
MVLIADVALAGAMLLVVAGVRHLGHGIGVIKAHALLPGWLVRHATRVEPIIGLALIVSWATGAETAIRCASASAAVWHLLLAGYLAVLLRTRGRVPCGCLDDTTSVSGAKVVIGVLLAAASAALAMGAAPPPEDMIDRLVHLPLASFAAALAVMVGSAADLLGTSGAVRR